jgi:hypothetical protein
MYLDRILTGFENIFWGYVFFLKIIFRQKQKIIQKVKLNVHLKNSSREISRLLYSPSFLSFETIFCFSIQNIIVFCKDLRKILKSNLKYNLWHITSKYCNFSVKILKKICNINTIGSNFEIPMWRLRSRWRPKLILVLTLTTHCIYFKCSNFFFI